MFEDTYHTIETTGEGVYREKGSKFIARVFPVEDEKVFFEKLEAIRKEFYDARHHCWAYMIGTDKSCFRSNDDGEPSGTAGKPILNQLLSNDLTNAGLVVVRYFGGTKLGVSGLISAYKTASREAIAQVAVVEKTINEIYSLEFEYPLMNEVMRLLKEEQLEQVNPLFALSCYLEVSIRKSECDRIVEKFKRCYGLKVSYLRTV